MPSAPSPVGAHEDRRWQIVAAILTVLLAVGVCWFVEWRSAAPPPPPVVLPYDPPPSK